MTGKQLCDKLGLSAYNESLVKHYKSFSVSGRLICSKEKDDKGQWHDTTEVERAKIGLEIQRKELERQKRLQAIAEKQSKADQYNGGRNV